MTPEEFKTKSIETSNETADNQDTYSKLYAYEGFLRGMTEFCHKRNIKWWQDPATGLPIERNVGELLCLIHSEISEAMEGHRKGLMDDKLPKRPMIEVELADALIRIFDLAGGLKLDLAGAWKDKMEFNSTRKDHSFEARIAPSGKKY